MSAVHTSVLDFRDGAQDLSFEEVRNNERSKAATVRERFRTVAVRTERKALD
jgi:hypothetical protein